jgi:hypothetical protein
LIYSRSYPLKKAEDQFSRVIEIRERVQGIYHQDTLNSIAHLASVYIHDRSWDLGKWVERSLLNQIRDNAQITEDEMEAVAEYFDERLITLLLKLKKDNVPVTEKVVKAAIRNGGNGIKVLTVLFDQRGNEVKRWLEQLLGMREERR